MAAYLNLVKRLVDSFRSITFVKISGANNSRADTLPKLVAAVEVNSKLTLKIGIQEKFDHATCSNGPECADN